MKDIIVAIDGYSSSGKSTMARQLARAVGYTYIDSGAMYRAVTLYAMRNGMVRSDGSIDVEALERVLPGLGIEFRVLKPGESAHMFLNGEDVEREIRSLEVSAHVSPVAKLPQVRNALTAIMRGYGRVGRIVMDGRDIGTTVFPDAEMKIFVNASAQERARRRYRELLDKGEQVDYDAVLANIIERDDIDVNRAESPLRKADDAIMLDNGSMTPDEQLRWLLAKFHSIADA